MEKALAVLFKKPDNCQVVSRADRASGLIDGESYFKALRQALLTAQECVYIIGWDIDSCFELLRETPDDDMPVQLRDLLNELVKRKPKLEIYILAWDFTPLLALDREWLPKYQLRSRTHERVHFNMQAAVAAGASHHQKFVVIDDSLAFSGGLDITHGRWDSPLHGLDDTRRRDSDDNEIPQPYHDVQFMVCGPCAQALGNIARERWEDACGERLTAPTPRTLWLDNYPADFNDCEIAISLTRAKGEPRGELRQVERLYQVMIATAQDYIYIENQYLTSDAIGAALTESLSRSSGPEIVIVSGYATAGWLSQYTMDVLRCRLSERLFEADRCKRLRIYYPHLPGADEDMTINVHAKIMVVDDVLLRIGSANLNNRSMGLDSECDLTLHAETDANRAAVRRFRNRLLAEHLDVTPEAIDEAHSEHGSLLEAIESLQGKPRTLKLLDLSPDTEILQNLPDQALVDPETPVDSDALRDILVPEPMRKGTASRVLMGGGLLLFALALAALWRWTPLAEWVGVDDIKDAIAMFKQSTYAPLVAVGITAAGGLVGIPISVLIVAVVLVFGALAGGLYSLIGGLLGAVLAYLVGQSLGQDTLRRLAGPKLNHISRQVASQGIMAVVIVRMIPIAPFLVVNLVAGASHIRLRDFTIGSLIGLLPGTVTLALVIDGVIRTANEPTFAHIALLLGVIAVLALITLLLRKWLMRIRDRQS